MTKRDALTEARRRWGVKGRIGLRRKIGPNRYRVGIFKTVPFPYTDIQGMGDTWEAAFADATSRERRRIEDERE